MTGFTLNQIKRGIERVEKKVDRIMEVPMKNAITFFKTANTEIMNGRFNDAYKNLNLVVVKSNEAFELTATKYINVETFNECTKALKLIIYSTICIVTMKKKRPLKFIQIFHQPTKKSLLFNWRK